MGLREKRNADTYETVRQRKKTTGEGERTYRSLEREHLPNNLSPSDPEGESIAKTPTQAGVATELDACRDTRRGNERRDREVAYVTYKQTAIPPGQTERRTEKSRPGKVNESLPTEGAGSRRKKRMC